ncbi:kelch repeat-containing protein [Kibdelosporangium persicum]|uniref:N-acetylneuraminic acid mutarotase n=1 Tax=Kibdelosporangium persicum TaxID=2698649 RepID=A0ABX2FGZ1_9PSEU|nr:kelch repeat-containing protein [Kibdelosporangium persicum]NRN70656.1 N-acetylneuraminic acid mutarotase [Kibdelosporangium persicum]
MYHKRFVAALLAAALAVPTGVAHAHPGHGGPATEAPAVNPLYGNGWQRLAPIAGGPRQEHSVAAIGKHVYVIGGIRPDGNGGFVTVPDVEVYDTIRNTWRHAAPLPVPMNHPNAVAVGGKLYVLGGLSGGASWQALRDSFVYNPVTDRWTALPPMPVGIERGSAAMGAFGRRIYLAGGMRTLTPGPGGLQDTVASVHSYDVLTRRWTTLPDLPEARDHVGGAVVGRTFYVLGGRDRGQVNVRDTTYAMDLPSGKWTERAPMPTPRGGIAAAAVGSKIYTFGGEGKIVNGANTVFSETEAYDVRSDRWEKLAPMPIPRHGTAAIAVGGTIYIPGGGNLGGGAPLDVHDAFRAK